MVVTIEKVKKNMTDKCWRDRIIQQYESLTAEGKEIIGIHHHVDVDHEYAWRSKRKFVEIRYETNTGYDSRIVYKSIK